MSKLIKKKWQIVGLGGLVVGLLLILLTGFIILSAPKPIKLQGTITKIESGCSRSLSLAKDGSVVAGEPMPCDSGEYIYIDGKQIQTRTGLVAKGGFSKEIGSLRPGDKVVVTYIKDEALQLNTLNCKTCTIIKQ